MAPSRRHVASRPRDRARSRLFLCPRETTPSAAPRSRRAVPSSRCLSVDDVGGSAEQLACLDVLLYRGRHLGLDVVRPLLRLPEADNLEESVLGGTVLV